MSRLIDCDQAINEISDTLAENDGEFIVRIYNEVMANKATYLEDSVIEVDE